MRGTLDALLLKASWKEASRLEIVEGGIVGSGMFFNSKSSISLFVRPMPVDAF